MELDHGDLAKQRLLMKRLRVQRFEHLLDRGSGACPLRIPAVADMVAQALEHFDNERYRLAAWCIMPNHVHVAAEITPDYGLAEVIHSWKSFTAKAANKVLGASGPFWQREYFDRLVRNRSHLRRIVSYIVRNPEKARLGDWRWLRAYPEREYNL